MPQVTASARTFLPPAGEEAAIELAQRRSAAVRRAVLERALRGELVPQDPSDEPAELLVARLSPDRAPSHPAEPTRRAPRADRSVVYIENVSSLSPRATAVQPSSDHVKMIVAAISDLHERVLPAVPPCDLLLVAGDIGARNWIEGPFADWLEQLDCEVVGIAGNHDWTALHEPELMRSLPWRYLQDETVRLGEHVIHGSPWTLPFMNWAFMLPEDQLAEKWRLIPADTTILVTHGPPQGTLDLVERGERVGSTSLRSRVDELAHLELHVFGHVHEGRGHHVRAGCVFANVTLLDAEYRPYPLSVPLFDLSRGPSPSHHVA